MTTTVNVHQLIEIHHSIIDSYTMGSTRMMMASTMVVLLMIAMKHDNVPSCSSFLLTPIRREHRCARWATATRRRYYHGDKHSIMATNQKVTRLVDHWQMKPLQLLLSASNYNQDSSSGTNDDDGGVHQGFITNDEEGDFTKSTDLQHSSLNNNNNNNNKSINRSKRMRKILTTLDEHFMYEGRLNSQLSSPSNRSSEQPQHEKNGQGITATTERQQDKEMLTCKNGIDNNDLVQHTANEDATMTFRFGYVSIIGAPNMGKSTLMNALLQQGILTNMPMQCQLAFYDTPGIIDQPFYKLQEGMMECVRGALKNADVLLVVTDVFSTFAATNESGGNDGDDKIGKNVAVVDNVLRKIQRSHKPVIVAVNKIDLMTEHRGGHQENTLTECKETNAASTRENEAERIPTSSDIQNTITNLGQRGEDEAATFTIEDTVTHWRKLLPNAIAIIPMCAREGSDNVGVKALRQMLSGGPDVPASFRDLGRPIPGMFREGERFVSNFQSQYLVPIGPPMFPEDTLTDRSERFFVSEMVRASLLETMKKEIPYSCEVRVVEFKEPKADDKKPVVRIKAVILVERESQKGIVVGKGGHQIKDIGIKARSRIEEFVQQKVHLELQVKVDKDWRKKESRLKEYGYLK